MTSASHLPYPSNVLGTPSQTLSEVLDEEPQTKGERTVVNTNSFWGLGFPEVLSRQQLARGELFLFVP